MATASTRRIVRLDQLAPGTRLKLYSRTRGDKPRSPMKWAGIPLMKYELEVVEHLHGVTWVKVHDREAPLWPGLRVLL